MNGLICWQHYNGFKETTANHHMSPTASFSSGMSGWYKSVGNAKLLVLPVTYFIGNW